MKYTVTLTLTLVIGVLIWVHLIQPGNAGNRPAVNPDTNVDRSPVFSLNGIYKGVCWTGEPRQLPDDAIDTVKTYGVEWISLTPFGWMQSQDTASVKLNTHHGWWGGTDAGIEARYDLAARFAALPKISVLLLFNDADEDFPPASSVLFEACTETYLDAECIAMLGSRLFRRLKAAAPDHDARP